MKYIKKNIPVGILGFIIILASRGAIAEGNIGWFELLTAIIGAVVFTLSSAFFDSHPMFNKDE